MQNWIVLMVIGILSVVAGIFALFNPFAASLTANMIAGWSFVVVGTLQLWDAYRLDGGRSRIWLMLFGLAAIVTGVFLVARPLQGMIALTIVVGAMFLAAGVTKLIVGFKFPSSNLKWIVLLSGVISAILGLMVLTNLPGSAVVTLGVLLAIELLSNGAALVSFSLLRKSGHV